MWIYNTVTEKWERQTDTLSKDNYDSLKVDLEKVKLYSRALSGATYLPISNIDNIYDALSYKDTNTWYIDPASSIYNATTGLPSNGNPINKDTISTYQKYKYENGFTLKNAFTPDKGIEEINYISADIATTTEIDVNAVFYALDGITLVEGQTVLVKNQISTVDLAFTVDPNSYFIGNYYLQTENTSDNTYYFYNSENGIYTYINNRLVKQTLATYSLSSNLTILVKLGTYADQQFALSRKLDGYYPVEGEPFEFKLSHNYLVRHRVDYHNLYENNYYDILKHSEQILNIDGFTYTVPERSLYIGDFGVILVNQDFVKSEYVYNVYKSNLKSITQTGQWYWMCGEDGTILKMSKINFSITKIDLGDEFKTLMSISFINDNRGIVVGKYNTIYYTIDGGWNWEKLEFDSIQNYSYNKVVYYSETTAYIGGENGIFLQLNYSDTYGWSLTQINISKDLTVTDQYDLIEDIQDMYYTRFNTWGLSYSSATSSTISTIKDCLFIVSNNGNIIVYDINNFINHDFLYLSFSQSLGDLTSITRQLGTNNIIISGNNTISFDINIFNSISTTSNLIVGSSYSVLYTDYNNKLFDYNGDSLFAVGNYGVASEYIYTSASYSYIESVDTKPRMLFMDYDLADKLNFFDANYDYRLPNTVTFSTVNNELKFDYISKGTLFGFEYSVLHLPYTEPSILNTSIPYTPSTIGDIIEIKMDNASYSVYDATYSVYNVLARIPSTGVTLIGIYNSYSVWGTSSTPVPNSSGTIILNATYSLKNITINYNDKTYLDYLIDSYKTYGVNANTALNNPIKLSPTFSYRTSSIATFSNSDISTTFNAELKNLYPNVGSSTASRYSNFTPFLPTSTNKVWLYRYIAIFKLESDFAKIGDVLMISSNSIDTIMMVNYSILSGSFRYYYAFTDLNGAIINNIKSSSILTITNLNNFSGYTELVDNFELHPFSNGYKLSYSEDIITVEPRFNNYTAYKSLETVVNIRYITGNIVSITSSYSETYNLFGYTPKYSLLSYLSSINSTFTASKVFSCMPKYTLLPCNSSGTFTDNNIYYDANTGTFSKNKIVFGNNLKYEYDTLMINTFVDLTAYTSAGNYTKNQIMISNKYYDTEIGGWAMEFSERVIDVENIALNNIDILSRNTLQQISNDLDLFNNLNKPLMSRQYNNSSYYMSFYDNPIKSKIDTDSYTKILLSDGDIKRYLSSIIYTDSKNRLSMDVINVSKLLQFNITDTFNYAGNLGLYTPNISILEGSILASTNFIGGSGSSEYLNTSYIGIHTLTKIDDNNLYANTSYLNVSSVADIGTINYYKFDPFFNYSPISLWDIGIDKMYKIPLELFESNLSQTGNTFSLINTDKNDYIFRLIDGLDINQVANKYHWIIEAEISDAIIGQNNNGIVWYKGIWHSGRWFGGTWQSGTWITGDWYNGNWYSNEVIDKINYVEVGTYNISASNSEWYNGRWYDGSWDNGNWYNGRLYGVTWSNGNWYNGIWNDGHWKNGIFSGGIWVQGTWDSGIFNSSNKPAFWIDGKFLSGDFQNGMWYNGFFGQNFNVISKFGSKSTNSRNATWQGGVWASGNFYSYENIDSTGKISPSLIQKYSIWKTGTWNQGNFYGGIVYNIEFLNGHWYTGITKDIQIIGIDATKNEIVLNGIFRFNINDYINIINNGNITPFSSVGSDSAPGRYRIALIRYDLTNNWTTLTLDYNFNLFAFDAPYKKPGGFYVGVTGLDSFGGIILYSTAVGQNGKNYSIGNTFSVVGGSTPAIGSITAVDTNGAVTSFNITTPGTGYSNGIYSTITSGSMSVSNADTKLKAVSLFKNVTWDSGVFGNGIVESGTFYGCIWYNGIFNGTWGI